jgi:hypothetical protein
MDTVEEAVTDLSILATVPDLISKQINVLYIILIILCIGILLILILNIVLTYLPINRIEKAAEASQNEIKAIGQTTSQTATDVETSINKLNDTLAKIEAFACKFEPTLPFCST